MMFTRLSASKHSLVQVLLLSAGALGQDPNLDQFNYDQTRGQDYGPTDWNQVSCPDLDTCLGWPDDWDVGKDWSLQRNYCRHCPPGRCGTHHQSPIDLRRNFADPNHQDFNECLDGHWMKYEDSGCTFEELQTKRQFTIERYGLRIGQPVEPIGSNNHRLACENRHFGRVDFPKGFSDWWFLSHTDIHLPSEHTQEGRRYDGELQLFHFYAVADVDAVFPGVHNQMGTISIFLEAFDNALDQPWFNRIICAWRREEELTRSECGLPSVETPYPGCFPYEREGDADVSPQSDGSNRNLRQSGKDNLQPGKRTTSFNSFQDLLMHNHLNMASGNTTYEPQRLVMDEHDFRQPDDIDWNAFIASQENHQDPKIASEHQKRHLINYDHIPWFNYWPMLAVRTEYYFRYGGTQTIPPCYGTWNPDENRKQTNHWRVMKDPMRISRRQLNEMHRLLLERIAPSGSPLNACQPDTASKPNTTDPEDPSKVFLARPIQGNKNAHFKVYCECQDWNNSRWPEDKEYCKKSLDDRFYGHPYNFNTDGEF